jgi:hypothetical protein
MSNAKKKQEQNSNKTDLEWEEVKDIFLAKNTLSDTEQKFAALCLQWEKTKVSYMSDILNLESFIRTTAEELMEAKKLDQSQTHELKLPNTEGEKGYFLTREEN